MSESELNPELKKLIETVIEKVDGLASDVRTTTYKVDSMEARFDQIDAKFDQIDAKFDQIGAKFDRIDAKFDRMDARLGRVETDLSRLRTDVKTLSGQFNDVGVMAIKDNQRIDTLEQRVGVLEEGVH